MDTYFHAYNHRESIVDCKDIFKWCVVDGSDGEIVGEMRVLEFVIK